MERGKLTHITQNKRARSTGRRLEGRASGLLVPVDDDPPLAVGVGSAVALMAICDDPVVAGLVIAVWPEDTETEDEQGVRRPYDGLLPLIDALVVRAVATNPLTPEADGVELITVRRCPHDADVRHRLAISGRPETHLAACPRYLVLTESVGR